MLEAMATGLVPIVVNYGGPGELVTPKTGFLVEMGSRKQLIERFRKILSDLLDNPSKIDTIGEYAARRVREYFTWKAKAKQVLEVYKWVLGSRGEKPDFGMPFPDIG